MARLLFLGQRGHLENGDEVVTLDLELFINGELAWVQYSLKWENTESFDIYFKFNSGLLDDGQHFAEENALIDRPHFIDDQGFHPFFVFLLF
jgi:hypothetical protein